MNVPSSSGLTITAAADSQRLRRVHSGMVGGGLVPFSAVCDCPSGRRRPPIRFNRRFAALLVETFPANQQIQTYKCGDCGGMVPLTVGHLDLSAPATSPM